MSEEIGICGVCHASQSYSWKNMLLMTDLPDVDWLSEPDVYTGDTWFCQGCGSSTSYTITKEKAIEASE